MFQWLRNKLVERHRLIFKYWDGKKIRRGDPIVLWRGLRTHQQFDLDKHLNLHDSTPLFEWSVRDDEGTRICADATAFVFGINRLQVSNGVQGAFGLTDLELIGVLKDFLGYVIDLKKTFNLSPINVQPMDQASSVSTPSPAPIPETNTQPTVDSTSTSTDLSSDSPGQLPPELRQSSVLTP